MGRYKFFCQKSTSNLLIEVYLKSDMDQKFTDLCEKFGSENRLKWPVFTIFFDAKIRSWVSIGECFLKGGFCRKMRVNIGRLDFRKK